MKPCRPFALLFAAVVALTTAGHPEIAWAQESPASAQPSSPEAVNTVNQKLRDALDAVNGTLGAALFYDVAFGAISIEEVSPGGEPVVDPKTGAPKQKPVKVPFIVAVLILGAIFFSVWYRFVNVRGFRHALDIVRGHYDKEEDVGDISHFRALTSALSATVGLGNIAGVAIAIRVGGPGAVFWMIVAAFFGMSAKFSSCTLSQLYRQKNPDGTISGGPMYYLDLGLKDTRLAPVGKGLGVLFALMVMGGSLGGGNMFQANQSFEAIQTAFGVDQSYDWIYGVVLAVLVGLVILGGIRRIGAATSRIVPVMVSIYVIASMLTIAVNIERVPEALALIFRMAFSENAAYGGAVGVLIMGVQRASFSNEAGLGSSAIAHAAAKTDEPVREGLVAMLEPFVDTIIVCLMTATVVVVTGAWNDPANVDKTGVALTAAAFATSIAWFPAILAICVLLFAYSTMISWAYYGERGWIYLLNHFGNRGLKTLVVYRVVFVGFVYVGAVTKLGPVIDFSDLMILCMAFPNIVGSVLLAPKVLEHVTAYWQRHTRGEFQPAKKPA